MVKPVERPGIPFSESAAAPSYDCCALANVTPGRLVLFGKDLSMTIPRAIQFERRGHGGVMCLCTKIPCLESSESAWLTEVDLSALCICRGIISFKMTLQCHGHTEMHLGSESGPRLSFPEAIQVSSFVVPELPHFEQKHIIEKHQLLFTWYWRETAIIRTFSLKKRNNLLFKILMRTALLLLDPFVKTSAIICLERKGGREGGGMGTSNDGGIARN